MTPEEHTKILNQLVKERDEAKRQELSNKLQAYHDQKSKEIKKLIYTNMMKVPYFTAYNRII